MPSQELSQTKCKPLQNPSPKKHKMASKERREINSKKEVALKAQQIKFVRRKLLWHRKLLKKTLIMNN